MFEKLLVKLCISIPYFEIFCNGASRKEAPLGSKGEDSNLILRLQFKEDKIFLLKE
jgi:hypothetical protein